MRRTSSAQAAARLVVAEPRRVAARAAAARMASLLGEPVGRTVGYADHGAAGMLTLFIRAVLCNWMVSTGVVGAFMTDNLLGKIACMWMPVMLFFYMGFEHSIVNMFLFPSGLLLGAEFTIMDYLIWNEQIWSTQRAREGWRQCGTAAASCYSGPDDSASHRNHVHVSFHPAGSAR